MSRWFRFYDAALDDPKVQRLSGDLFKSWINLLCLASRNGGRLPDLPDVSFAMRISEAEVQSVIGKLSVAGLMDATEDGWEPHNWAARQYKSDSSTERVREHRRNVPETLPETLLLCSVSVNNEAQSKKVSASEASAAFDKLWIAYPKRKGPNPRKPAYDKFIRLLRAGENPEDIISGARRYAALDSTKPGTEFVPQLVTWLNQERWRDTQPEEAREIVRPQPPGDFVEYDTEGWYVMTGDYRARGAIPPAPIHTLNGKRGAYVQRERTAA